MLSAGEVGAVFVIKDEASAVLKRLMDQFNALEAKIDQVKIAFKELTFPTGLNRSIGNMEKALAGVGTQAERTAALTKEGFAAVDTSVARTAEGVAALKAEMIGLGRAGRDIRASAAGGGGGTVGPNGLPAPRGGGGHGGRAGMFQVHERIGPVGIRPHDSEMVAGAVAGFTVWEALKASADLQEVQNNMRGAGVSNAEIDKATKAAYDLGQKYGLTARNILQSINEIRNPLNKGTTADEGVESALGHADMLARMSVALKNRFGGQGEDTAKEIYDLVKSAEFRNSIGDADFDKAMGAMVAANVSTGGIVKPRDWLQVSQKLRGALPGLSDDFLYTIVPELIQEFGGPQAGTAGSSLYQQLVAGSMRTVGVRELQKLGLVNDKKAQFDKNGRIVRMMPGGYLDEDVFKADQMKGMADLVLAMNEHGITDIGAQRDELSTIFGNRVAAQLAMVLAYQDARLRRGAQGIKDAEDPSIFARQKLQDNPYTQWDKFTSAATNAGAALGANLMPSATAALNNLTATVNGLAQLFSGHGDASSLRSVLFGSGEVPAWYKWAEGNWKKGKGDINSPNMSQDLMGIGTRDNPIRAEPLPVKVVGAMPDDLAARRAQFEKMNPTGRIAPIEQVAQNVVSAPMALPGAFNPSTGGPHAMAPPGPINVAPPNVSVTAPITATVPTTVTVTASLDGIVSQLAAKVVSVVMGEVRSVVGALHYDASAHPVYPDHGGIGHQ
jgi:hypothetical protein